MNGGGDKHWAGGCIAIMIEDLAFVEISFIERAFRCNNAHPTCVYQALREHRAHLSVSSTRTLAHYKLRLC